MTENVKIGVVIQGPLLSRGRTGQTANIGFFQVMQSDVVDYDCTPNIVELFSQYSHEFDDIVCVTWDTEDTSELEAKIGKQAIMSIADTTPILPAKGTIITGNNKYRQFLSTLKGLERLAKNGCTYALKIRTDQYLDLSKMKEHLLKILVEKNNTNRILVPAGTMQAPDEVEDFYFGARTDRLIDACKVFLDKPELFSNSVHADFFYKCAWLFDKGSSWPPNDSFTPSGKYSKSQYFVIQSAWSTTFATFPRKIYETLVWRGEKFPKSFLDNFFYDNLSPSDLTSLISSKIKIRIFPKIYIKILKWLPEPVKMLIKRFIGLVS
jgi:hypothetical protein